MAPFYDTKSNEESSDCLENDSSCSSEIANVTQQQGWNDLNAGNVNVSQQLQTANFQPKAEPMDDCGNSSFIVLYTNECNEYGSNSVGSDTSGFQQDEQDAVLVKNTNMTVDVYRSQKDAHLKCVQIYDPVAGEVSSLDSASNKASKCEEHFDTGEEAIENFEHKSYKKPGKIRRAWQYLGILSPSQPVDDRHEYIEFDNREIKDTDALGYSARFSHDGMMIVLHNEGSLMITENNFIATIKITGTLNFDDCRDIERAKPILMNKIRIMHVIQCGLRTQLKVTRENFYSTVENIMADASSNEFDYCELLLLMEKIKLDETFTYEKLGQAIVNNHRMSKKLKKIAEETRSLEQKINNRDKKLVCFGMNVSSDKLTDEWRIMTKNSIDKHRDLLLQKAPHFLREKLQNLSPQQIVLIDVNDVNLYANISHFLDKEIFQQPIEDLADRWIRRIKSKEQVDTGTNTNYIYFSLCKSLDETINEIVNESTCTKQQLLVSNSTGWHPIEKIPWTVEDCNTKCLEYEYRFIMKLLHFYDPSSCVQKKSFQYTMKVLKIMSHTDDATNTLGIAEEIYVWCCMLDDVVSQVLDSAPQETRVDFSIFEDTVKNYIYYISNVGHDQLETVRVITHNTTRFIVQSKPYVEENCDSSLNRQLLRRQLEIVNSLTVEHSSSIRYFRDLMDIFKSYWRNGNKILAKLPTKIDLPSMHQLRDKLTNLMLQAMHKKVTIDEVMGFLRAYYDFLIDLDEVSFEWFIKGSITDNKFISAIEGLDLIQVVDNRWANTDSKTYRVIDPKKFAKCAPPIMEVETGPTHYVIDIVDTLVSLIEIQLQRKCWSAGKHLEPSEQISSATELMSAIRISLIYLGEQPDYVSFEQFYNESVKPFDSLMNRCDSLANFITRANLIRESFWYIRRQNEMDIEKALKLYSNLNENQETQLLRNLYERYQKSFGEYILMFEGEDTEQRILAIVKKVKADIEKRYFNDWCCKYKMEKIPKILAGLAAVWSILVSKDVLGTGKYLSPHCIQILCILKLLSIDNSSENVTNKLAQVLTGQGKSLILGMIAALLALMGHNIRTVCYNRGLVTRDQMSFQQFFSYFGIQKNIVYGTYEDMANALLNVEVNGEKKGLRDLVSDLLLEEKKSVFRSDNANLEKSVLLMDEVDVFFTREFYGNNYDPIANPFITGMGRIQIEIWKAVCEQCYDVKTLTQRIERYILSFINSEVFAEFLQSPSKYQLLVSTDSKLVTKCYTNRTLFDEHLKLMLECAIEVHRCPAEQCCNFRLSERDTITYKFQGEFTNYKRISYLNVFHYFRLKRTNFCSQIAGELNYGYINIECGSLSYAMLPKNYPLILGVSGTITALNKIEKDAMRNLYNIVDMTVLPTFFGSSYLIEHDFRHFSTKNAWLDAIFSRTQEMVGASRAVLIFFKTDTELNEFKGKYSGRFDRLIVLTENTDSDRQLLYVNEAGIVKTVTLATRCMGRGIDYKSSVAVEKNGGIHVIQTFFSLDIKEETQIKGRTARKDNKGSYELIVSDHDLQTERVWQQKDENTYTNLNKARTEIAFKESKAMWNAISDASKDHKTTMDYLNSFFVPQNDCRRYVLVN
ncbi:uncharacterized protein LOC131438187 [Malaya genurostris]|uniref:uncharacterized protein LOC131438187 n=1 Tax=Malaya genurostris TaxID=325434 RepID=UPI0026F398CF|nr:uncharacterized protein LOC131438187 [Malaya genurostris]XP_058464007.1 uncharacterized protein LOC131438187 [Malaya genurostris]